MHRTVASLASLTNGCVKSNTVLDDVMDPIVGNFSTRCFTLHDLNHCSVCLQMTHIPNFVVEDLGRITNRKDR